MATRKYWYHYTAIAMLTLLSLGALTLGNLPKYTCAVEDYKVVSCMFLYNNDKTCAIPNKVISEDGTESWEWKGDTCTKNRVYSEWELLENYVRLPVDESKLGGDSIEVTRPIIMTKAKVVKTVDGVKYIEGYCTSTI